tara:strand:+ start:1013 stop:1981 length:969 start_codon:yes stop_codon:yes gene_type:complete
MSAFKQFSTKDVTITPFDTNKEFSITGAAMTASAVGIEVYGGGKTPFDTFNPIPSNQTGFVNKQYRDLVYENTKQLYYTNYVSSSQGDIATTQSIIPGVTREDDRFVGLTTSPRFENYLQSSLTQSRNFPQEIGERMSVISIPQKLFGENIVPFTFNVEYTSSDNNTIYKLKDDGDGNVVIDSISGSSAKGLVGDNVGQIFYSHGITVLTTSSVAALGTHLRNLSNLDDLTINFQSSLRIYENQYKCTINENEFQYSLNPTLLSGSNNDVYYDYVTGSNFTPYISTVGLYNESNELLMVGKLSSPIPISKHIDTTIMVNIDT